jgi:hypothetical protein
MPIIPTVGRKVWFFENASQVEPWDATVIKVCHQYTPADESGSPTYIQVADCPTTPVNLLVTHPDLGVQSLVTNVTAGDSGSPYQHYRWMPYQQAQAAKSA